MYSYRNRSSNQNYGEETNVDNIKVDAPGMSHGGYMREASPRENFDMESSPSSTPKLSPKLSRAVQKHQGVMDHGTHKFEMGGAPQGGKLANEIHEEFLVCKICLEQYKSPKSLQCLHTFCEQCIESHVASETTYKKYSDYREFTCPLCRKRTQLPIGGVKKLPDNFLVQSLGEIIGRQKPSKFPFCDICKMVSHKHKEAASKCLDCVKLLCKDCVMTHKETKVTSNHNIFDVEIEKDIECKEHADEVVRFYCEPCDTCICVLCTFNEHKDHEITQFGEAVAKYRDHIQDMLLACKNKIDKFDTQLVCLNKAEEIIKGTEQQIHDTAIKFISDIRTAEKKSIDELHNIYGKELLEHIENKKDIGITVEGLRSTCSLTEVILQGKDMELLLLKKDVQKKLSSLGDIIIKTMPTTVTKVVKYIPGDIDLGVLHDLDRPFVSKSRTKTKNSDGHILHLTSKETQTEGVSNKNKSSKSGRHSDDSEEDDKSQSELESEEESSDEDEEKKKSFVDTGVQTEHHNTDSSSECESEEERDKKDMRDESTETDEIFTEEKAVNTRSRSLQGVNQANQTNQSHQTQGHSPNHDSSDENSLAARRRRRRERAGSSIYGGSISGDIPPDENYNRKQHNFRNTVDNGEVFWDADGPHC